MDTARRHILINTHYMPIGGAEKALLGLLDAIDKEKYQVTVMINRHTGELMDKLLKMKGVYVCDEDFDCKLVLGPLSESIKEHKFGMAYAKIKSRVCHAVYRFFHPLKERKDDFTAFDILWRNAIKFVPEIPFKYDIAISFLMPHYFIAKKIKAYQKIAWIHTDYSAIAVNAEDELPVWAEYDNIVAISEAVKDSFIKVFPSLKEKVTVIPNITSESLLRSEAEVETVKEYDKSHINIVSIGRICFAKNFEIIPSVASILRDRGLKFIWHIIGPGDDSAIRKEIERTGTADVVKIHGPKANPYPYTANADIYVQPSRYEGKCVAVEEAKILHTPVVLTPYPTAVTQIEDGVTGLISRSFEATDIADAIERLAGDVSLRSAITKNLSQQHYGNEDAINLLYGILKVQKIPAIIHYCWFGKKRRPRSVKKNIGSWFEQNGFNYIVRRWDEKNFDVNFSPYTKQAYEAGNYAFVSDVARLKALVEEGGIYFDTDVEQIKPINTMLFQDAFLGFEGTKHIGTAVMGCVPHHPLFEEFLNLYKELSLVKDDKGTIDTDTNVKRLTELLESHGLKRNGRQQTVAGVNIYPSDVFSPYDYVDGTLHKTENTITIHWFSQSWLGIKGIRRHCSQLYHRLRGIRLE